MKVFCIGTIAADLYLSATESNYYVGGISSNVAIGLAAIAIKPTLVARIGNDTLGTILKDKLNSKGVKVVNNFSKKPTPIILVESDQNNNVSYVAHLNNTCYAELYPTDIPSDLKEDEENCIVILDGTILQNNNLHYWFLPFLENYKKRGGTIIFDINWRDHLTSDAAIILKKILQLADIIKGTPDEFSLLAKDSVEIIIQTNYPDQICLLTKASKGCSIYYKNKSVNLLAIKAEKVVDPSGCGDAFVAGFTKGYIDLISKEPNRKIEVVDLIRSAKLGNYLASIVITTKGGNNYPAKLDGENNLYTMPLHINDINDIDNVNLDHCFI